MARRARKPGGVRGHTEGAPSVIAAKLDEMLDSDVVRKGMETLAEDVADYWKQIAPVFDAADPREHRKSPSRGSPGDYRDSITYTYVGGSHPHVRVYAQNWKAAIIEYRNSLTTGVAPLAMVKAHFGAQADTRGDDGP